MNVIAIDVGYGDVKVVSGDEFKIDKIFKFNSVVAVIETSDLVTDNRVISYDKNYYYIGKDALALQTESIIEIVDYDKLEYFSPLFVMKAIRECEVVPDKLILGLSIAQINNSGYYKKKIEEFLKLSGMAPEIIVLPQGAVAKLAIDKYSTTFPEKTINFNPEMSYLIADIGFNTLDICHVVNGKTSSNSVRGLENEGIVNIVRDVVNEIKETYGIELSVPEAKEVVTSGQFKRRGRTYDCFQIVEKAKNSYISRLQDLIEENFGKIIDKVDGIYFIGGGAYVFASPKEDEFFKVPRNSAEFYNAIGYYQWGIK